MSHAIAAVQSSGWHIVIGRCNEQGAVSFSMVPVVAFVVRADKSVAPVAINPETLLSGEVEQAYPEVASGRASYRLLSPGIDALSSGELQEFEARVSERYAAFTVNEEAKRRREARYAHFKSPEYLIPMRKKQATIIAATRTRLERDRAERLSADLFGDN